MRTTPEQQNPHADATAIVLAGGRSSRMGRPKALLPFGGRPLITHIIAALRQRFAGVLIVAAPDQDLPLLGADVVRDEVPGQGPVAGILYGLQAARHDVCFVTSCDSACVDLQFVSHLLSLSEGYDVVVPRWDGRLQPLHAVYRRSVVPLLRAQLANGELRPVFLFDRVRTRYVPEEEVRRFDPEGTMFFNVNTPADYAEALRRWQP